MTRNSSAVFVAVAGIALVAVPWTSASAASPAAQASSGTQSMLITNFTYSSPDLTVDVGDTVRWTNLDKAPHDITTDVAPEEFESPTLKTGDMFSHTFLKPGKYPYYCSIHPQMVASITVAGPATTAGTTTPGTTTEPAAGTKDVDGTKTARSTDSAKAVKDTAAAVTPDKAKAAKATAVEPTPAPTTTPIPAKGTSAVAAPAAAPVTAEPITTEAGTAPTPAPASSLAAAPVGTTALRSDNSDVTRTLEVALSLVALALMASLGYQLGSGRRAQSR